METGQFPKSFREIYDAYTASVSPAAMALSLQSLEAIWQQLRVLRPRRVLEYGSGVSTCLLALFASRHDCEVESFDSEEEWAAKTSQFLKEQGLEKWVKVSLADSVEAAAPATFILWDFDSGSNRELLMPLAYANLTPGGIMYVDDMHSVGIEAACNGLGGERIGDTPRDGFGRYGAFVRKPETSDVTAAQKKPISPHGPDGKTLIATQQVEE